MAFAFKEIRLFEAPTLAIRQCFTVWVVHLYEESS